MIRRMIRHWWNPRKNAARVASVIRAQRCDYAVLQVGKLVLLVRREYRPFLQNEGTAE